MSELTFDKVSLPEALVGLLLLNCKAAIEIHCVSVVSACHRTGNALAQLWPPGFDSWWPFLFTATGQKKPHS
jgi:hypothetical protein